MDATKILPWVCLAFVGFVILTFLVLIPNAKRDGRTEGIAEMQDSLDVAPIVLRDTVTVTEQGRTITVSRHDTIFIHEETAEEFYNEQPETLASDNASVSFVLRETVNKETGEFAHSYEDIRFKFNQITNTVAVNAPPVPKPFYRGVYVQADIGSEFRRFQPFVSFGTGLGFDLGETELKIGLGATYFETQEPMYYYKLGATWWL